MSEGTASKVKVARAGVLFADDWDHYFIENIIREGFEQFIDSVVETFKEEVKDNKLGFIGGVAFQKEQLLREVVSARRLKMVPVIKSPIIPLINHFKTIHND